MERGNPLRYGDIILLELLIAGENNPLEGLTPNSHRLIVAYMVWRPDLPMARLQVYQHTCSRRGRRIVATPSFWFRT
jgi:hypothetical protein